MAAAAEFWLLAEDHLHVFKPASPSTPRAAAVEAPPAPGLRQSQIDPPVRLEVRVHRDVEQTALALGKDFGHARQRLRHIVLAIDDAQGSGPLGDEDSTVRKEGYRPRVGKAAGHGLDRTLPVSVSITRCCARSVANSPRRRPQRER
jgi:hypothetical protein